MSVASGSTCWRRYARVSRTRSSSNGIGLSTILGSPVAGAVGAAIALLVASACAHTAATPSAPPRARLWIGGDVFLGPGGHGALASIPAIVGGAPGIVNLEGPVGDGGAPGGANGSPIRLTQAPRALA